MPKSIKHLLIGSTEPYSGKSAAVLAIAHHLQEKGIDLAYGKPVGAYREDSQTEILDADVQFVAETLSLPKTRLLPTLLFLEEKAIQQRLRGADQRDYLESLGRYLERQEGDLLLLEGPGTLDEGSLFNLTLIDIAESLDASVLLVSRFCSTLSVDSLLAAKQRLGDRLLGGIINNVPSEKNEVAETLIKPFLEQQSIPVFGLLPSSTLLQSVTVSELVHQLEATVLCCGDRLELMVEELTIGAMNVNAALEYFRKGNNMAVVTGSDRTDIQLAALETSTHCLILTGHTAPSPMIVGRAEELEIPIISVDLDTLTTVEIIDRTFGQVRLHEPAKVHYIRQKLAQHFDIDRLLQALGLEPATV